MKDGLTAKCFKFLEATNNTVLVEASPYDMLWGAGVSIKDPNLANMQLWNGDNLLSKISKRLGKM